MTTPREDRAASPSVREALAALLESAAIGSDAVAGGLMSNPHWPALVAAILAEADAAEPVGPWGACWYQSPYGDRRELPYVYEQDKEGRTMRWSFGSMAKARAVANCFNRLSARSRRDEGGAANG